MPAIEGRFAPSISFVNGAAGATVVGDRLASNRSDATSCRPDGGIASDCHHTRLAIRCCATCCFSRGGRPAGEKVCCRSANWKRAAGRALHFEQMCEKP